MKGWIKLLGVGLVAACCLLYLRQVHGVLMDSRVDFAALVRLFPAAIGTYMLAYLAAAMAWHMLVAIVEDAPRPALDLGIFTAAQFAKYLPGNIGHHVGRVFLSVKSGYSSTRVIATMVVELAMVLFAMLVLSLPVLGHWAQELPRGIRIAEITAVVAGIAIAGGVSLVLACRSGRSAPVAAIMESFQYAWSRKLPAALLFLAAFLLVCLQIILTALSLGLLDESGTLLSIQHLPTLVAVFSGAWLLGFIIPGAPAGIGIREMVLSEGLTPVTGRDIAVLLALYFRILSVVADLVAFLAGVGILSVLRHQNVPDSSVN